MTTLSIHTLSPAALEAFYREAEQLGALTLSDESGRPSWPPKQDRAEQAKEAISPRKSDPALQRRVDAAKRAISGGTDEQAKERAADVQRSMTGTADPAVKARAERVRKAIGANR